MGGQPDLWIVDQIAKRVKKLYENSTLPQDEPIQNLTWGYGHGEEPEIELVGLELNGYYVDSGKPVESFANLRDDGSTTSGCWVYCGCMTTKPNGELDYKPKWRDNTDNSKTGLGLYSNWAWSWPLNRRIVYNRCSVQPDGVNPWPGDDDRVLIKWDPGAGAWVGDDVCDFNKTLAPTAPGGTNPFIMKPDGVGGLFATTTSMKDGPFPNTTNRGEPV